MEPVEIKKDIYCMSAVDWGIRDFHGYSTYKGTTYNAYLVMDEKITLFDTVKKGFGGELLCGISTIVDPAKIDYVVVNHVEMDHSGSLPEVMEAVRPEKLFCSQMGKEGLLAHYHRDDWPYEVVSSGSTVSLGKKTVQFIETRMLHWPDSMFSYIKEDSLLISSDAFGQHWATSERFDDEIAPPSVLLRHAAKYYANILLPYSPLIRKLLASVQELGLEIDMIAPDHGLIWRGEPTRIIGAYDMWSAQKGKQKALVIYDTMWRSTEAMARAVGEGLNKEGVSVQLMDLRANHRSDVITEVLDAKGLIFGSSTLNNGVLPRVADMLAYAKGLKPANKMGAAFGSYGWSGEAVKLINHALEEMKIDVVDPGIRIRYVPTHDDLGRCTELGSKIGKAIKKEA